MDLDRTGGPNTPMEFCVISVIFNYLVTKFNHSNLTHSLGPPSKAILIDRSLVYDSEARFSL